MKRPIFIVSLLLGLSVSARAAGAPPSVEKLQKLTEKIRSLKSGVVVKTAKKSSAVRARGVSRATALRSFYRQMAAVDFRACLSSNLPKEHRSLVAAGLKRLSVAGEKAGWDPDSLTSVEATADQCACPAGTAMIGTDGYGLCYCAAPDSSSTNKSSRPVSARLEKALSKLDPVAAEATRRVSARETPKSDPKVGAEISARYQRAIAFERMAAAATRPAFPATPIGKDGKPDLSRIPTSADLKPLATKLSSGQGSIYVLRSLPKARGYRSVTIPRSAAVRGTYRMMAALDYRAALLAGLPTDKSRAAVAGLWRIHSAAVRTAPKSARKSRRSARKAGVRIADDDGGDDGGGGDGGGADYSYSPPEDTSGGDEAPAYVPAPSDDTSYQGATDDTVDTTPAFDGGDTGYTAPDDGGADAYTPPVDDTPAFVYNPPDDSNSDAFALPTDGGDQSAATGSDDDGSGDQSAVTGSGDDDGGDQAAATGSGDDGSGDQTATTGSGDSGSGDQLTPPMPTDGPAVPPAPPVDPLAGTPVTDPGTTDPAPNGDSQYTLTWGQPSGPADGDQLTPPMPTDGSGATTTPPPAPADSGANGPTDQTAGGTGDGSGAGGNSCLFGICNNATLGPDDGDAWGGATGAPPQLPLIPFPGQGGNPGPDDPVVVNGGTPDSGGWDTVPATGPAPAPDSQDDDYVQVPDSDQPATPDDGSAQPAVAPVPPAEISDAPPAPPQPPAPKLTAGTCDTTDDGIVRCRPDAGTTISKKYGKAGAVRRKFGRPLKLCPMSSVAVHAARGAFAICAAPASRHAAKKSGLARKSKLTHALARLDLSARAVSKAISSSKADRARTAALFLRRAQLYEGMASAIRLKRGAPPRASRRAAAPHAVKAKTPPYGVKAAPVRAKPVQAKPLADAPPPPPEPAPEPPSEAPAPPPAPKSDEDQMEDMEKQMHDEVQKRSGGQ
jgi:hypothetical protein